MLIIFQFTVAIFVFIGSLVISRQVAYFFSKDLGYQKAQLMTIASVPRDWSMAGVQRMEGIRDQLAHIPGINNVSLSFEIPDGSSSGSVRISPQGRDSTQAITANTITADSHFALTYGLKLSAGEFFRTGTDSAQVVLNESAVSALGWESPEKALNQTVRFRGEPFRVRGVLKDFHAGSLHQPIKPLVFIQVQKDPIYRYFSLQPEARPAQSNHCGNRPGMGEAAS